MGGHAPAKANCKRQKTIPCNVSELRSRLTLSPLSRTRPAVGRIFPGLPEEAFQLSMAEPKRASGTVKWFSTQKGFGFIAPDDGGDDLFVHQTSICSDGFRTLFEGQLVEFSVEFGEDMRTKAADVAVLDRSRRGGGGGGGGGGGRGWYGGGRFGGGGGYGRGGGGRRGGAYGGGGGYGSSHGGEGGFGGGGACYNCGRMGHLARDCYQGGGRGGGGGGGRGGRRFGGGRGYGGGGGGGGYGGGGGGRGCFNCGEEGHLARDCPNEQE